MKLDVVEPAKSAPPTFVELADSVLGRVASGDDAATRQFVLHYQDLVYGYLSRLLGARDQTSMVEDVAQDTFIRALGALERFDPTGPARVSTWILTIATRRAIDLLRRTRNHVDLDTVPLIAGERPDRRVITRSVYRAIASLSPEQRAAFLLREFYGLTVAETAEALETAPGTVKSRVARARIQLRASLRGRYE